MDKDSMGAALEKDISLQVDNSIITGGWKKCCEEFFNYTKKKIEEQTGNNTQVAGEIVLTGGASKMGFIKELADKVYPVNKKYTVTCEKNPSFSVSHGLVWIGLLDEYEDEIVSIVTKTVKESGSANIDNLSHSIEYFMCGIFYQLVVSSVTNWTDSHIDESINDLRVRIINKIENAKENIINSINKILLASWSKDIENEICTHLKMEINKRFNFDLQQNLVIPDSFWDDNINIDADVIVNRVEVDWILSDIILRYNMKKYNFKDYTNNSGIDVSNINMPLVMYSLISDYQDVYNMIDINKAINKSIRNNVLKLVKEMRGNDIGNVIHIHNAMIHSRYDKGFDVELVVRRAYEIITINTRYNALKAL